MPAAQHHTKTASHMRPLSLAEDGLNQPGSGTTTGRFADPGRLTEKKKEAIAKTLVKLKIGDRDSCNLFVRAMEYELNTYREAAAEEAESAALQPAPVQTANLPAADFPELQVIARAAADLAALLEALPYEAEHGLLDNLEAQDPLQRGYDQRYLQQMQIEVLRLADACAAAPQAASTQIETAPAPTSEAAQSAASQYFVASLVHMFEECFERAPTADPDGDFAKALNAISEGTGVPMRLDRAALELALMPTMG